MLSKNGGTWISLWVAAIPKRTKFPRPSVSTTPVTSFNQFGPSQLDIISPLLRLSLHLPT